MITTGSTVLTGLEVLLKEYQCKQSNIILITLFSTPDGLQRLCELHPELTIVVSEVNTVAPNHFGQKYFGKKLSIQSFTIHRHFFAFRNGLKDMFDVILFFVVFLPVSWNEETIDLFFSLLDG